ncbi:MAG: glycosyltransferase family 4 protein [Deltaproteobacteria bacterium]|nr:glycosyltransferase family 4 protein [Deltaproteobacteria bacterium]
MASGRPRRLLTVIESLTRGGGAEQALLHLLPYLRPLGFEVRVAALWGPEDLAPALEASGIRVHALGTSWSERWHVQTIQPRLRAIAAEYRPDIVHAHLFFAGVHCALLPDAAAPTRVITFHNMDYDIEPPITWPRRARKRIHELLVRGRFDGCVGVSAAVAQHYQHALHLPHVDAIANALPTDEIAPRSVDRNDVLARFGVPEGTPVIGMPGRLVKQKGHAVLLDALKILESRSLRPSVLALGGGPLEAELRTSIRDRGLSDRVVMHQPLPHDRLMDVLRAVDLVVMPSLHEGFGIVAAEAMSLAKPLVASDIPPLREIVDDEVSGLLVTPGDAGALADGIQRILENPGFGANLAAKARDRVVERFSSAAIASQWATHYERLLSRSPTS